MATRPARGFFDPDLVDFGEVGVGRGARRRILFQNASGRSLFVRSVRFDPPADALAAFLEGGGTLNGSTLPAGRSLPVEVRFAPRAPGLFDTTMRVETDALIVELPIVARARVERPATPRLEPEQIAFPAIPAGAVAMVRLELVNQGDRVGTIVASSASPPFTLTAEGGVPVDRLPPLAPDERVTLEARYAPATPAAEDSGRASVRFDAGGSAEVVLAGRSLPIVELQCSPGVVDFGALRRGARDVRTVRCSASSAPWAAERVEIAPGSSASFLLEGPARPDAEGLAVDVAFEARGLAGRRLGVLAVSGPGVEARIGLEGSVEPPGPGEADLALVLTWNTPHSDFDLHLVRAGGAPFDLDDDCHYFAKNPDWGRPEVRADDPFLDRDDREGYGPETVALLEAAEESFDVFVQYHDFTRERVEPSTVELGYWLRGAPEELRARRDLVACGEWWHVGRYHRGPPARFELVDRLSMDFRGRAAPRCR